MSKGYGETKSEKAKFSNGVPKTAHPVREYSDSSKQFTPIRKTKDTGIADGGYLQSTSKDGSKKKDWLNKGAFLEHHINVIYGKAEGDRLDSVLSLKAIAEMIYGESLNEEIKNKFNDIESLSYKIKGAFNSGIDPDIYWPDIYEILEEIKPEIEKMIIHEKASELLGGEINRLITEREQTPKTRLMHDSSKDTLSVQSRILDNSEDLIGFIHEKPENLNKNLKVKGFFEAIIIRCFLGDNWRDIKFDNLLIVPRKDSEGNEYYQVENIDFGNAFTTDYTKSTRTSSAITPSIDAESLINFIYNFNQESISIITRYFSYQETKKFRETTNKAKAFLLANCDPAEIEATFTKIANLKTEDLEFLVETLSEIKGNDGTEKVSAETKTRYLEILKRNQAAFAGKETKQAETAPETKSTNSFPENVSSNQTENKSSTQGNEASTNLKPEVEESKKELDKTRQTSDIVVNHSTENVPSNQNLDSEDEELAKLREELRKEREAFEKERAEFEAFKREKAEFEALKLEVEKLRKEVKDMKPIAPKELEQQENPISHAPSLAVEKPVIDGNLFPTSKSTERK